MDNIPCPEWRRTEEEGGGFFFFVSFFSFLWERRRLAARGEKDLVVGTEGPGAITGGRKEEKEGGIAPNFMAGSHGTTFSSLFFGKGPILRG